MPSQLEMIFDQLHLLTTDELVKLIKIAAELLEQSQFATEQKLASESTLPPTERESL
jgi:hypothetical protein